MQATMKPGFFDAADGLKLYADWHLPDKGEAKAGVVVVHGYADHGGRYAELARHLAQRGYAVMTFDYRGHGQAGGRRGHCDSFDEFLADFDRACGRARDALGQRPLAVFAHSHGALIALRAFSEPGRAPRGVSVLAMSSPYLGIAMKVSPLKVGLGHVASRLAPRLSMPNGIDPAMLTHDPRQLAARRVDRFCHNVATARWFTESTAAQEYVLAHVSALSLPTLWMLASDDRLVDASLARRAYERAGGDKQLLVYDGFYHEVWNETDRSRVYTDLEAWLSRKVLGN